MIPQDAEGHCDGFVVVRESVLKSERQVPSFNLEPVMDGQKLRALGIEGGKEAADDRGRGVPRQDAWVEYADSRLDIEREGDVKLGVTSISELLVLSSRECEMVHDPYEIDQ
jgi:hypothetical protein